MDLARDDAVVADATGEKGDQLEAQGVVQPRGAGQHGVGPVEQGDGCEDGDVLSEGDVAGRAAPSLEGVVHEGEVVEDQRPPLRRLDPGHPDADASGFVSLPRVDVVSEIANVLSASRSYEANLVIIRKLREMSEAAQQIGR